MQIQSNIPQTKSQWVSFLTYMLLEYGLGKQSLVQAKSTFELLVETPIMLVVSGVKKLLSKGKSNGNKPSSPNPGN